MSQFCVVDHMSRQVLFVLLARAFVTVYLLSSVHYTFDCLTSWSLSFTDAVVFTFVYNSLSLAV